MILGELKDSQEAYIIHFTHNDSDALGCAVLLNLFASAVYNGTSTNIKARVINIFSTTSMIDNTINEFSDFICDDSMETFHDEIIDKSKIMSVIISDVGPKKETVEKLVNTINGISNKLFTTKFLGFDHHITNNLDNDFDWFRVEPTQIIPIPRMKTVKSGNDIILKDEVIADQIKVSATFLLYMYVRQFHNIFKRLIIYQFAMDISMYDTWEWKSNELFRGSRRQDRTQKLINMVGIKYATKEITDSINRQLKSRLSDVYENGTTNKPLSWNMIDAKFYYDSDVAEYIPSRYMTTYELSILKSLRSVKLSRFNVKCANCDNVLRSLYINKLFLDNFDDLDETNPIPIYMTIHDSDDDIGEIATFINKFLHPLVYGDNRCIYIHIFPRSLTLSFRSDYFDVSSIAVKLGGGGHKTASGAKISSDMMINLLKVFYGYDDKKFSCVDYLNNIEEISNKFNEAFEKYKSEMPMILNLDVDKIL